MTRLCYHLILSLCNFEILKCFKLCFDFDRVLNIDLLSDKSLSSLGDILLFLLFSRILTYF